MTHLTEARIRKIAMQEIRAALLDFANHCDSTEDAVYSAARATAADVEERMTRPRERPAPPVADKDAEIARVPSAPPVVRSGIMTQAEIDVLTERETQRSRWGDQHDDGHKAGELAKAAGVYAVVAGSTEIDDGVWDGDDGIWGYWPWLVDDWRSRDRRSTMVMSAAMLIAEIDRMDRAALAESAKSGKREGL